MTHLKAGDKAPNFEAKNQNNELVKLSDLKGKILVLYFYPKDDTPGCTKEACSFRDDHALLAQHHISVVGVSTDGSASHLKFSEKYNLPFILLADEDKKIVSDYGVWGEKKFMGKVYNGTHRISFIIDADGKILHVIQKVDTANASKQILSLLNF